MRTIRTIILSGILLLSIALITSCKHQQAASSGTSDDSKSTTVNVEGGSGTSYEDAVIILDSTETSGVHAEYAWLKEHYPGYSLIQQSLSYSNGKPYDVMEIKTASGQKKKIYFDISHYFGKW